jgi:hypothetical protein
MQIEIPILKEFSLKISNDSNQRNNFATSELQKGFLLMHAGKSLAEEAVGFGIPVIKKKLHTLFSGSVALDSQKVNGIWTIHAVYDLNLEERIIDVHAHIPKAELLYRTKNLLAAFIRRFPFFRRTLTRLSSQLRTTFGWKTTYQKSNLNPRIRITYTIPEFSGRMNVETNISGVPDDEFSEIVIMNEQAALYFNHYMDTDMNSFKDDQIGCWDAVSATKATFISQTHKVSFSLSQVKGIKLFRGWEKIGSRLDWSGFGYSFPPKLGKFSYTLRIEKLP